MASGGGSLPARIFTWIDGINSSGAESRHRAPPYVPRSPTDLATFEASAAKVAQVLRALANERRLMILCKLVEWGEANVTTLAEAVGLSQSALSQHLARMREEGIVDYRREGQTLWYRVSSRASSFCSHSCNGFIATTEREV